jgi:hypothetical protein
MSLLEPLNRVGCYLSFPNSLDADIANDVTCRTIDIWPTVFDVMGLDPSDSDKEAIEGMTLNLFEDMLPEDDEDVLEPPKSRMLYSEHVEWNVFRNPTWGEPNNPDRIPLMNYGIGFGDWTLVMDADQDHPVALFARRDYSNPVTGCSDITKSLVKRFVSHYKERQKFIEYNEEHYIENSNEFVRDKLREAMLLR